MNPRDYRTWTSFADHPIFSTRATSYADWSSDPDVYSDRRDLPAVYNPDWYVHIDPRYPTDVQAECAANDLRNLAAVCGALTQRFDDISHELFILDDLTVYVHMVADRLVLDIYPVNFDDARPRLRCWKVFWFAMLLPSVACFDLPRRGHRLFGNVCSFW